MDLKMKYFILLAFVSLAVAQCEKPVEDYGACLKACDETFTQGFEVAERGQCVQDNCLDILDKVDACKSGNETLEVNSQTAGTNSDTVTVEPSAVPEEVNAGGFAWLGIIVFLTLLGIGIVYYFKTFDK